MVQLHSALLIALIITLGTPFVDGPVIQAYYLHALLAESFDKKPPKILFHILKNFSCM
jgi:hypothetical protein